MTIRNGLASSIIALTLAATIPQSTVQSAIESPIPNPQSPIRKPQSAIESPIRSPQSAIRSPKSAMGQWRMLSDGDSRDAWRGYKSDRVPAGWTIAKGVLSKDGHVGDLITKDEFGDFELQLD